MENLIFVPIIIGSDKQIIETLIECGMCGMFIDQNFAKEFTIENLEKLIKAFNIDGTKNKKGMIKSYVDLEFQIGHKKFKEQFYVTGLGKQRVILGFPWLNKHNLIIDWKKGEIKWQPMKIDWKGLLEKGQRIRMEQQPQVKEIIDKEETKNCTNIPIEEDKNTILIELLEETNYHHPNDWTIKNSYPLPLISEIMDKLKGTKYFTKLDACWGYNNIQIRKGDEWKVAFKTNKGLFKPTVMFFGMCNSLERFQAMMDCKGNCKLDPANLAGDPRSILFS